MRKVVTLRHFSWITLLIDEQLRWFHKSLSQRVHVHHFCFHEMFFWFHEARGILGEILSQNLLLLCKAFLFIREVLLQNGCATFLFAGHETFFAKFFHGTSCSFTKFVATAGVPFATCSPVLATVSFLSARMVTFAAESSFSLIMMVFVSLNDFWGIFTLWAAKASL